jgi:hypothetical protein
MRAQGDSDDIQPIMSAEAFIAAKEAQVRREASVPIRTKDIGARGHNQWQK